MRQAIVGAALLLGLAGCVSVQRVVPEQLVNSEVTIRQAEEAGAEQIPEAARHLQWARDQTREARKLIEQNRRADAALYLQRADADAALALALAREAPARAEADQARQQVQQLQENPVQQ